MPRYKYWETVRNLSNINLNFANLLLAEPPSSVWLTLPAETLAGCRSADAILLGAIGGPQWDGLALDKRPEARWACGRRWSCTLICGRSGCVRR